MAEPITSLWNTTDETFHITSDDELAIKVVASRVATSSFWLGVLTTLVIALVLLSTSKQRKGPIFVLQCLALIMAIAYNVLVYVRAVWRHHSTFRMPDEPYDPGKENRAQTTVLAMEYWIPLVSDAAIIFKVMGFYPSQLYSLRSRTLRASPPIFLLLVRTALICYLTYISNVIYTEATSLSGQVKQVFSLDLLDIFVYVGTTIFAIEAAFCLYTSCFLIYKICQFYFNLKQQDDGRIIRRKSRLFVEITCMTFIPPFFLSILCAVFLYQSDNGPSKYREAVAALANISVVFSLLATSWSTIRMHNSSRSDTDEDANEISLVSRICFGDQYRQRQREVGDESFKTRRESQRCATTTTKAGSSTVNLYHNEEADISSSREDGFKTWSEAIAESMPLATMSSSISTRGEQATSTSARTGSRHDEGEEEWLRTNEGPKPK